VNDLLRFVVAVVVTACAAGFMLYAPRRRE